MAVAITQTANPAGVAASANVATYTGASIGTAAANRFVVLVVGAELANASPNSATIDFGSGDVAMSAGTLANQGAVYARTFYYPVPTGTTATFKVTFGATPNDTQNHVAVYSVTGGVFNASNGVADTDADPISTGSVTIPASGGMIAICSDAATTARTWTGLAEDIDADTTAFRFSTGTSITGGAVTTTVSGGNAEDGAISWISFKPGALIQAAVGSYALTGTAATVRRGLIVVGGVGGYALTGTTTTISKGQKIVVDAGEFALTGADAALREAQKVGADAGAFALTGTDATLTPTLAMSTFDSGSHLQNATLSGGDLTVTSGSGAICAARSTTSKTTEKVVVQFSVGTRSGFTMLGIQLESYDPAVESNIIGYESPPESIAYQANGNIEKAASAVGGADSWIAGDVVMLAIDFTALLFWARRYTSGAWGNWNNSGTSDPATGTEGESFSDLGSGTYYYGFGSNASGDAITVDPTAALGPSISGFSAWDDVSGLVISPNAGSFALTGTDAALREARKVIAGEGSFALTGTDAALREARKVIAGEGIYSLAGVDASLEAGRRIGVDTGSFALTGTDATLTLAEVAASISAELGSYSLTGTDAGVKADWRVAAEVGSYSLTGTDASLKLAHRVDAAVGSFNLTGTAATLTNSGGDVPGGDLPTNEGMMASVGSMMGA